MTDPDLADAIAGDLNEEYRRRATVSAIRACVWLAWVVATILGHIALRRVFLAMTGGHLQRAIARVFPEIKTVTRGLFRSPAYATAIVAVVAVSVALTTTVFAVVDAGLFRPLPYPDASRLFVVDAGFEGVERVAAGERVSARDITEWSAALPDVRFTAYTTQPILFGADDVVDVSMTVARVQASFFDTLGVQPERGGFANDAFEAASKNTPVVVTQGFWRSVLGSDPNAVGRRLVVDPIAGTSLEIVGVMPAGFVFPAAGEISLMAPFVQSSADQQDFQRRSFAVVLARLPTEGRPADFESRLNGVVRALVAAFPTPRTPPGATADMRARSGPFSTARLVPVVEHVARRVRAIFFGILLTAVLLVSLACVNVSSLVVARASNRGRDLIVRRAVGAGTADLVRLIVIESVVLVGGGAAISLVVTPALISLARLLVPDDLRFFTAPSLDWRVMMFALATTGLAAVAVAVVPAWRTAQLARMSGVGLNAAPPRPHLARIIALTLQIAGSLVLAIAGSLFVASLLTVQHSEIGIDVERVAAVDIRLLPEPAERSAQAAARQRLAAALLDEIRALPSVEQAAMTSSPLFTRTVRSASARGPLTAGARFFPGGQEVTSGFRDVLAPRLIDGRWFTDDEIASRANVAVIDEVMARGWWPDARAVGQTLTGFNHQFTVIGVTSEARYYAWDLHGRVATMYQPASFAQADGQQTLVVSGPDPDRALRETMDLLRRAAPAVRISRSGPLTTLIADSIRERRLQSWLFGSLATAALAILGVGVLGFVAMSTSSRTREIGVRVALGATPSGVIRLLMREQMVGVLVGVAAGVVTAAWFVRTLETYLYETTPYDRIVWVTAIIVVFVTTVTGTLIPARRSSRIEPVAALRAE